MDSGQEHSRARAPHKQAATQASTSAPSVSVSGSRSNMAATCDVSFDEMAVALSYISLGSGASAPASSARGLPAAPAKKDEKPAADDDVRTRYCSTT